MSKATKVTLSLECVYTEVELAEKRDLLANAILEMQTVEDRKASSAKSFKEAIDGLYSQSSKLAYQIKSKSEFRGVDCAIHYNSPNSGEKTTVRLDTGEIVKTEPMSTSERQEELEFSEIDASRIAEEAAKRINADALDDDTVKVTATTKLTQ